MAYTLENQTAQPLSFTEAASPVPTDQATVQRTLKTDYALGPESPGATALSQAILSGNESQLRTDVAASETIRNEQARIGVMMKLAQQGQLSPEQIDVARHMSGADLNVDAGTVFEKKFAEKYTQDTIQTKGDDSQSIYNRFGYFNPTVASEDVDVYAGVLRSQEYEKNQLENLHGEWEKSSWLSAIPQYAGQLVPLLSAYRLSNVLKDAPTTTILPGDNLGQQISYLKALPAGERKAAYDAALTDLKGRNMLDAMTFAQAVVSFNATDSFLSNAIGVADATGIATTLGKGLVKIGGKLMRQPVAAVVDKSVVEAAAIAPEKYGPNLPGTVDYTMAAIQEMQKDMGTASKGVAQTYYLRAEDAQKLQAVTKSTKSPTEFVNKWRDTPDEVKMTPDDMTVYVSKEAANDLKNGTENRIVVMQNGDIARSTKQKDGQWSLPIQQHAFETEPAVGRYPVILNDRVNKFGTTIFNQPDVQGEITKVTRPAGEHQFYTDIVNAKTAKPVPKGEGTVPVHVNEDGTIQMGDIVKGETYYVPGSSLGGALTKRPLNIHMRNGEPVFTSKGAFIEHSTEPVDGWVPVTVSRDGTHVVYGEKVTPTADKAANDFRTGLKDSAKAAADTELNPTSMLTQMGDVPKAAQAEASIKLQKITTPDGATSLNEILETLPSAFNPGNFFGKGKALSREYTDRIVNKLQRDNEFLLGLLNKLQVPRGTEQAIQVGVRETEGKFRAQYGGRLNDAIVDFVHVPPELNPNKVNVDTLVMRVGQPNGLPFDSRAMAEQYMKDVYEINGEIQQQGASFYITAQKTVDETSEAFLKALHTTDNTTPVNLVNMVLNRFRSSEDLLATTQRQNRNIATHAPQILTKALKEQIEFTSSKLTGKQRKEVLQVLEVNRDETNAATGMRGLFYTDAGQFEQAFVSKLGHLPTQEQTAHYFNHVRVSDFDWLVRNLASYRDKARLGIEQFSWKGLNAKSGKVENTAFVEGKALDQIPWGGQDAGIWIQEAGGSGRLVYKHSLVDSKGGLTKAEVEKLYKEDGYKIFQVLEPAKRPLKDTIGSDEQVHFVISNGLDQKALGWNQVDYRPGGHSIYKYDFYVKQPQLQVGQGGRLNYYGDNSIMNFASKAQAEKYAERMNKARLMLKNADPDLDSYLAAKIPYSRKDFEKMFNKDHLSLDHPIVSVKSGTTSFDLDHIKRDYPNYVDATKSEYNLGALMDRSFQADRDAVLDTVREGKGIFQIAKAEQLDPYTALNRGLGQAVRNLWMADYKISAVQHWIEEFGPVMDPKFKTVSNSPMYFLYNPQWNEKADKAMLAAAKASRNAIVNFIGAQSEIASSVTHLQNKLVSSIYEKFGQNASEMVADHALPVIKDPSTYVRAVAFHSKLGFFNPIQLFVQSQSLAHVLAVAGPKNGLAGMAGGFIARRLIHNDTPEILDRMASIASNMGWKAEDFKQMIGALKASGISEVAGEAALRDDVFDPKLYNSTVGRWLDKGTMFFAEGERAVRLAAFATSFREWKLANPLLDLSNREMGKVMQRADLLSVNMTRASASSWQNGLLSIPTQFMAFNARLAEQFLGKRLTTAEKARAFGTYSMLYGVPTAAAGVAGVYPFYDDIKQAGLARGVDFSPAYMQAIVEGIPHLMISSITGHEYNIAQRLGPNGASIFKDALSGEKNVAQVIGGPASSIIGDIWNSTDPVRRAIAGAFTGNSEAFPVKTSDLVGALSTISTLGLASRIQGALSYGKYISKNNLTVGDMDSVDAAFAVVGLTPTHIADAQLMSKVMKGDKAHQKPFEDLALQNYARALQAAANNDDVGFRDYMTRVTAYVKLGDLNVEDQQKLYRRAQSYKPDSEDRIRWDMVKNAPDSQYSSRFNSFFTNQGGNK